MRQGKRWFLKVELGVLVFVVCIWIVKSATVDIAHNDMIPPPKELDKHPQVKTSLAQVSELDLSVVSKHVSDTKATEVFMHTEQIQQDLSNITESNLNNIAETQIRQEQNAILHEQDDRIDEVQQWLQNERQNIEKWYADAKQRLPEQRKEIEERYQNAVAKLHQWKTIALEELNTADRGAAARFIQSQNDTISFNSDTSFTHGYISPGGYLNATTYSFGTSRSSVLGDPAGLFRLEIASISNSRIEVENIYQEELGNLQNQKSRYLNSISADSLQCEKTRAIQEAERYAENARWAADSKKRDIITATEDRLAGGPGVVIDAIDYTGKKSFCMILGDIYRQGDTINGFKIHKISASEVIFEKDGKTFAKGLQ